MKTHTVYRLRNLQGQTMWIGQTINLEARLLHHSRWRYGACYGVQFTHEIIAEGLSKDAALRLESWLIAYHNIADRLSMLNRATYGCRGFKRRASSNELTSLHSNMILVDSFGKQFKNVKHAARWHRLSTSNISANSNGKTNYCWSRRFGAGKFQKIRVSFRWLTKLECSKGGL